MKMVKKVFIITALSLIAAGALLFGLVVSIFGIEYNDINTVEMYKKEHTLTQDFESINITDTISNVLIKGSADGKTRVTVNESECFYHNVNVIEGTLEITTTNKAKWYHNIGVSTENYTVTVEIPMQDKVIKDLNIKTVYGDIKVEDVFTTNVKLQSTAGEIGLNANTTGAIMLKTVSGEIYCNAPIATDLNVESTSGDVEIKNMSMAGNSKIKTTSGDIELENCTAKKLDITSASGGVEGKMAVDMTYVVDTLSGRVKVPHTMGDGICKITTNSGDIEFE